MNYICVVENVIKLSKKQAVVSKNKEIIKTISDRSELGGRKFRDVAMSSAMEEHRYYWILRSGRIDWGEALLMLNELGFQVDITKTDKIRP